MRAKQIATLTMGVTAALLIMPLHRSVFQSSSGGRSPDPVVLNAPALNETTDRTGPAETERPEPVAADADTPLPVLQSADTSDLWGQSLDECIAKRRLAVFVCKQRFEPRDPIWAPAAEQRIRDFVADTPLLRLPAEGSSHYWLECRATFCEVHLNVDREGLTDYLRSAGRYDASKARAHEFFYLIFSLTPSADGTRSGRWAEDRAEELRLALVLRGLLRADSTVAVHAHEPAYREQDSFLSFEVSRCPNRSDLCAAQ